MLLTGVDKKGESRMIFLLQDYRSLLHMIYNLIENRLYKRGDNSPQTRPDTECERRSKKKKSRQCKGYFDPQREVHNRMGRSHKL